MKTRKSKENSDEERDCAKYVQCLALVMVWSTRGAKCFGDKNITISLFIEYTMADLACIELSKPAKCRMMTDKILGTMYLDIHSAN